MTLAERKAWIEELHAEIQAVVREEEEAKAALAAERESVVAS